MLNDRYKSELQFFQCFPNKLQIDESDLIAAVLDKAPDEYQAVLTSTQLAHPNDLELDHLEKAMFTHWRAKYGVSNDEKGDREVSLSNVNDRNRNASNTNESNNQQKLTQRDIRVKCIKIPLIPYRSYFKVFSSHA